MVCKDALELARRFLGTDASMTDCVDIMLGEYLYGSAVEARRTVSEVRGVGGTGCGPLRYLAAAGAASRGSARET